MRTYTTIVYSFDELTEDAKQYALRRLSDINVDFDWWQAIYDQAEEVGVIITSFGLDSEAYVVSRFAASAGESAYAILAQSGDADLRTAAMVYMDEYQKARTQQCQADADQLCEAHSYECGVYDVILDDIDTGEIDDDLHQAINECYRIILQRGYEYLTSEDAIIETIRANEYEFTADGRLHGGVS